MPQKIRRNPPPPNPKPQSPPPPNPKAQSPPVEKPPLHLNVSVPTTARMVQTKHATKQDGQRAAPTIKLFVPHKDLVAKSKSLWLRRNLDPQDLGLARTGRTHLLPHSVTARHSRSFTTRTKAKMGA